MDLNPGRPVVATIARPDAAAVEQLLRDGADNHTIARRLGISYTAAQARINRVLTATSMPDRTALAVALLRHDVVLRVHASHESSRGSKRTAA